MYVIILALFFCFHNMHFYLLFFSDFDQTQCIVSNLKEYWPYNFQVTAVVTSGNEMWRNSSGISSNVTTKQESKI